ncbi:MAG: hypothetical protein NT062_25725 [Proteobacteria bacterium]|nr:hypothetical protein [Pseudomonadota bacterium]
MTLALNARTRATTQLVVEKLQGVAAEYFLIPTLVDDAGDQLVLDYALDAASSSFAAARGRWRDELAGYLPELVGMAVYLESCVRVLDQIDVPALIAPACLRYTPASGPRSFGAWRLMVVPLVDVALVDWARSAPDAWAWTSARTLLGKPSNSTVSIGAALHAAIADERARLPSPERFRRAVRGRIGGSIATRIASALPASFVGEAALLGDVVRGLLDGEPAQARLRELGDALAPYRTAVRWEYEGRIDIARAILERHAATSPADAVPWDVLARLRTRDRDVAGALEATIGALAASDDGPQDSTFHGALRELAVQTRRLAHGDDGLSDTTRRGMIERAVAAADAQGAKLGDSGRLHFAHIEARYLQRWEAAEARLATVAQDAWDNVLRTVLLARIHAAKSAWAHVARSCKEARLATQRMPLSGGDLGAYVIAYLDFLDGVAHFGAIGVYDDPLYMADAFSRFVASLDATRTICAPDDPLVDANIHWLWWIGAMATQLAVPDARTIRTGVEAYLSAHGLQDRISEKQRREVPPLVWYDASRLLALSGAP